MFDSKQLKEPTKYSLLALSKEGNFIHKSLYFLKSNLWYPIEDFYHTYSERISRSFAFAKIGWLNYDFDSNYVYGLMLFKFERIKKCLINGHAIQEKEDLDALDEIIVILSRLSKDDYDSKYHEEHNKKWGDLDCAHPPLLDKDGKPTGYYRLNMSRKGVVTDEDKKIERVEFLRCFDVGEEDRIKDIDRLGFLLKNYMHKWWD